MFKLLQAGKNTIYTLKKMLEKVLTKFQINFI